MSVFWGPIIATAALALWWLFASGVSWLDRLVTVVICLTAAGEVYSLSHPSLMPMGIFIFGLPMVSTLAILWLLATPFLGWPTRRFGLWATVLLASSYICLLRLDGVTGSLDGEKAFRWEQTAEQKFLAARAQATSSTTPAPTKPGETLVLQPGDWPAFRGADRNGSRPGVRIATDWKDHPPQPLWRHRVGPGWSSLAVVGDRLWTQEQRDEEEVVVCYSTKTGDQLWEHKNKDRFTEVVAGPGPRATPTFYEGCIYVYGAKGRLECLDALTGNLKWSVDVAEDAKAKVPTWGFASSPLVYKGIVTVFAGGPNGKSVMAYHADTGKPAWSGGEGQQSYCSLEAARIGDTDQLLMSTDKGVTSFEPAQGQVLWHHAWELPEGMTRVVQPSLLGDDVLLGTGFSFGTRRIHIHHENNAWTNTEAWSTKAISPYYNDLVIHKNHLYGFDGPFLVCVSLEDGKGKWRARGYNNGQVLLLPDQDLLVVLSEKGAVALVEANPDAHRELGRFQAVEGKTWNHPVIAHGKLFVRNGEEMACYQLTEEPAKP
jgi:outer membrane protein assembly factor BamB